MRRATWPPVAMVLLVAGCQPLPAEPTSAAPVNACGGTTGLGCGGYPAEAGVTCQITGDASTCVPGLGSGCTCQVNTIDSFVLVVTVPPLAPVSAGTTYTITAEDLYAPIAGVTECMDYPALSPDLCFQLEATEPAYGTYAVTPAQAAGAGRYVGTENVSLPVSVTFWPYWPAPGGGATDARLLNLPLPPVFADVGCHITGQDTVTLAEPATLPACEFLGAATPFEWLAALAPLDTSPGYLSVVQVTPPYNDAFPDFSYPVTFVDEANGIEVGTTPTTMPGQVAPAPIGALPLSVQRADGTPFASGWTAYLRDPTTHLVVSSHAPLTGAMPSVHLNYFGTLPTGFQVVIAPPPSDTTSPTLVEASYSGTLPIAVPELPPLVHVSGVVAAPDGTGVSAQLLFYSTALDDTAGCAVVTDAGPKPVYLADLSYEKEISTDDVLTPGGTVGGFEVDLPQGSYAVVLAPEPDSFYAKDVYRELDVAVTPPVCTGASPSLTGVRLTVSPQVTVTGTVTTADGRPLAAAEVDLSPAAHLAPTLSPSVAVVGSWPCPPDGCQELWPRPYATTTNDDGVFTVTVDPASEYDVTVRPAAGTGFPWLVWPDQVFMSDAPSSGAGGVASAVNAFPQQSLQALVVPAPFFLSVSLLDPDQNPVSGADVTAYAFTNHVAVAIGESVTDTSGHFSMALSTSFPTD